jgi:hypothetical protein
MLKSALIAIAVLAVAAPGFALAKGAKKAAADDSSVQGPAAPIPYSQLADEDAKLNGPAGGAKHHAAKKKAAPKKEAAASDAAPAK